MLDIKHNEFDLNYVEYLVEKNYGTHYTGDRFA